MIYFYLGNYFSYLLPTHLVLFKINMKKTHTKKTDPLISFSSLLASLRREHEKFALKFNLIFFTKLKMEGIEHRRKVILYYGGKLVFVRGGK